MVNFPKVYIIILNWNEPEATLNCIDSFLQLEYPVPQLLVVDNASTDDSISIIKARFPNINVIQTDKNLGYTGGNNAGIKYALEHKVDYVLIVNNDTEAINPYFLNQMIRTMEEDYSIGIMGPKVLNPQGIVQQTILFVPTLVNSIFNSISVSIFSEIHNQRRHNYDIRQPVEAVSGVCWLIRSKVIERIGLLDEEYFMYCEEQDYCYRAQKAGWRIMYNPVESILHRKKGQGENKENARRQYIYTRRNLVLFVHKHLSLVQALILAGLFLTSNGLKILITGLRQGGRGFHDASLLLRLFNEFKYVFTRQWR